MGSSVHFAPIIQPKEARVDDEKNMTEVETVTDAPPVPKRTRKPAAKKSPPKKKVKKAKAKTNSKTAKVGGPRGPRKDSTRTQTYEYLMEHKGKQVLIAALDKAVKNGSKCLNYLSARMKDNKEPFELRKEKNQKG